MRRTNIAYVILLTITLWRLLSYCGTDILGCGAADSYSVRRKNEELTFISKLKGTWVERTQRRLPSPHSELLLGMTIGADYFYLVPKFKKMLRDTGTIHVVVVSGYNVSLVYNSLIRLLGSPYKARNLVIGVLATLFYALISGFEPPVVRAWIMGSVIALGKYYGRKLDVLQVLLFTALLIIAVGPSYLFSLSFQLSFLATLSLVLFEKRISKKVLSVFRGKSALTEDLSATLAAQVLIWPYLSYKFSQISVISPLVNALILWTVPLSTILGGIFLLTSGISVISQAISIIVFVPLDLFVALIKLFSHVEHSVIDFEFGLPMLLIYYVLLVVYLRKTRNAA